MGTGSTVNQLIELLPMVVSTDIKMVSSSIESTKRLKDKGYQVLDTSQVSSVALYIDGADEVDPSFALIKGGGGALTQEKIVASMSHRFVCIVDESKVVERLGSFPLPVEVIPAAQAIVAQTLQSMGGSPTVRSGLTDNGNAIIDVASMPIDDPERVERVVNSIPGVVTIGIFAIHKPHELFVSRTNGTVEHKVRADESAC